ncbi:hypothetical protein OSTOST_02074 [Ostertagia ostertagi]
MTKGNISAFTSQCKNADVIKLIGQSRLPTQGLSVREFMSLVHAPVLEMCIRVEMSTIIELDFSFLMSLIGKCEGPRLVIAQNLKLKEIKFSDHFMKKSKPNSVVIRGNPMLQYSTIERLRKNFRPGALDLQVFGECGPPLPLSSFAAFLGCKEVFGVISVNKNITEVARLPIVKRLQFEGCLHITDTKISNVDFLDDISTFTMSPYHKECAHEIIDNLNLCIRDPQYVKKKFKGLVIIQDESCGKQQMFCIVNV